MIVFAIETSCDETSAAVVRHGEVCSNLVSSQISLHQEYGGVVPELAAREHLRQIDTICREALRQSRLGWNEVDAIVATRGPGLPNALQVGFHTAQSLAFSLEKPFLGVHHHEAHLYSPWIYGNPMRGHWDSWRPSISLIVSGGHTLLLECPEEGAMRILGGTLDDAAGECFDKVAKLLGLPYPGGPWVDRLAQEGNPNAKRFPRPMIHDPNFDFSFSGLKTSVRYFLEKHQSRIRDRDFICDMCAGVQAAIVETLVEKTMRAVQEREMNLVTLSGGVAANRGLREAFTDRCMKEGIDFMVAPQTLSGDNAAMVGILGERRLTLHGLNKRDSWDQDPLPSWSLQSLSTFQ